MPGKSNMDRVLSLDAKSFDSGCGDRVVRKIRIRTGKHHAVEEAIYMCICDMHSKRTNINVILINLNHVN